MNLHSLNRDYRVERERRKPPGLILLAEIASGCEDTVSGPPSPEDSPMDTLRIDKDEQLPGLVTVTLNRPEKLNAINFRMHADIQEACRALADDAEARVVIFTGEGRAFTAGADLGGTP